MLVPYWNTRSKMKSTACSDHCPSGPIHGGKERPPTIRAEKVLEIKRQLGEGRYSIVERLDVVLDRMLEAVLG